MASLPALPPTAPPADIVLHLQDMIQQQPTDTTITLYPQLISFRDSTHRHNWEGYIADHDQYQIYSAFLQHPLKRATTRAGLFSTGIDTWVGKNWQAKKQWDYHAWAALIRGVVGKKGKDLVIWDPDGQEMLKEGDGKYNKVTLGSQKELYRLVKKGMKVNNVWFGGDGNNGKEKCLALTVEWLRGIVETGGLEGDLEEMGFVRLDFS